MCAHEVVLIVGCVYVCVVFVFVVWLHVYRFLSDLGVFVVSCVVCLRGCSWHVFGGVDLIVCVCLFVCCYCVCVLCFSCVCFAVCVWSVCFCCE